MSVIDLGGRRPQLHACKALRRPPPRLIAPVPEFLLPDPLRGHRNSTKIHGMTTARELPIRLDMAAIAAFCRARGISRLSLFGSVLRSDFDPISSDVDVLAEFRPGALDQVGWEFELYGHALSEIIGHRVDLVTNPRPWLRETLNKEALPIYVET